MFIYINLFGLLIFAYMGTDLKSNYAHFVS